MKTRSSTPVRTVSLKHRSKPSREIVLKALRRAIKAAGGKHVSLVSFLVSSGLKQRDIFRHFGRWRDAVLAAGVVLEYNNTPLESDQLLIDWGSVARKLGRLPGLVEYGQEGNHTHTTVRKRFDGWINVPHAFREFAADKPEWADVLELIATSKPNSRWQRHQKPPGLPKSRWLTRRAIGRPGNAANARGVPLDISVFRYAPMNESGVVLLFGSMAERLGFVFESVRTSYPDCLAARQVGPDVWENVRIEFEHMSRNFHHHAHDPKGCDLIVCWEHNWPECPVEVLALKDELEKMKSGHK